MANEDVTHEDVVKAYHLRLARDNGATEEELIEVITDLAFCAGSPQAMSAMAVATRLLRDDNE